MMDSSSPRVIFFGTPDFAVPSLKILLEHSFEICAVVTASDKPSGRGLKLHPSPVKGFAMEHGLPVIEPLLLDDPALVAQLTAFKPDIMVVVAFRKLPVVVWKIPRFGTFNLHASLLPDYRGAAPIQWAIINGESSTGLTTFFIDEKIDTGNILLYKEIQILPEDTCGSLSARMREEGATLVLETALGLVRNTLVPVPQGTMDLKEKVLHPAPKIRKQDCLINWYKTAKEVSDFIRGLNPFPGAYTTLSDTGNQDYVTKLLSANVLSENLEGDPGTIETDGKTFIHIVCGEGALNILELQLGGGKVMNVRSFLNGHSLFAGWRVKK